MDTIIIKEIASRMEEYLNVLDSFSIEVRDSLEDKDALLYEEGFRGYIKYFQEQVIQYLSLSNKNMYSVKQRFRYSKILQLHVDNNDLPEELLKFLEMLRFCRNETAHGYESPKFEIIFKFFNLERSKFDLLIATLYKRVQKESKENAIKKLNLFQ